MIRRSSFVALLAAVLLIISFTDVALAAQEGVKQVGLVITFPDGTEHLEVVTVPADATMFDALQVARIDLANADTGFGAAVCGINKVGCPAENCFCDKDHFWAYYHLDPATNRWQASAQGVDAFTPASGAVEALVWSGMDANFMPTDQPKPHTFQELAGAAPQSLPKTGSGSLPVAVAAGLLLAVAGVVSRTILRRGGKEA
jgi:LPXTG-motif cell wall-anchored protein